MRTPRAHLFTPRRDSELVECGGRRCSCSSATIVQLRHDLNALLSVRYTKCSIDVNIAQLETIYLVGIRLLSQLVRRFDCHGEHASTWVEDVALDLMLADPGVLVAP